MNKLKNLFSPRKFVYYILIIVLIITIPNLNQQSMGQTNAIVTLLSVDKVNGEVEVCANIVKPSESGGMCCEKYTAQSTTLGEAIEDIGFSIGKELAFSQCEVMAFGDQISNEGIMSALDYMTRVKKVSRNTLLINVGGEIKEFNQAVIDAQSKKKLKLEEMLGSNNKYITQKEHSIETFYQKYYSPLGQVALPRLEVTQDEFINAIEVSLEANSSGGTNAGGQANAQPKYLINNGDTSVYIKGKKAIEMDNSTAHKLSLLNKKGYRGTIKVDNVSDELYDNATLLFEVTNGKTKYGVSYDGDIPKCNIHISLLTFIEEIIENEPNKKFLIRNEEFMSDEAISRLKATVQKQALEAIEYSKDNDLDLFDIYSQFDKFQHKKTKELLDSQSIIEFLDSVEYSVSVDVKSTY